MFTRSLEALVHCQSSCNAYTLSLYMQAWYVCVLVSLECCGTTSVSVPLLRPFLPAMSESVDGGAKLKGKASPALSGNKVMKRKSFSAARRIDTTLKVK